MTRTSSYPHASRHPSRRRSWRRSGRTTLHAAGAAVLALAALLPLPAAAQEGRQVTWTDLMQVRQIEGAAISADGRWVAYAAAPDRGDPEVVVREADGDGRWTVALADQPSLSPDGAWLAARTVASLEARETSDDPPRNGMALMALPGDGAVERVDDVASFAFSPDGRWLAVHHLAPEEEDGTDQPGEEEAEEEAGRPGEPGTLLVLRELGTGNEVRLEEVRAWAFRDDGAALAYSVAGDDPAGDALRVRSLDDGAEAEAHAAASTRYASLAWLPDGEELAFFAGPDDDSGEPVHGQVLVWDGEEARSAAHRDDAPAGWVIPSNTELEWSDDGARLFLGWRPLRPDERDEEDGAGTEDEDAFDPFDPEAILQDRAVDVWHWQDLRIMPQQKVVWEREKDRTYAAVWHRDGDRVVALGGPDLPDVEIPENGERALAGSDLPYRRAFTWAGGRADAYVVELETGARTLFAEGIRSGPELSPDGRYAVWWEGGQYHLFDAGEGSMRTLTEGFPVPMADEDHDYPDPAPGYGVAGWLEDDAAVLLYDKYDLWMVPTDGGEAWRVTDGRGRAGTRIFRLAELEAQEGALAPDQEVVLTSYHDLRKNFGFYRARLDRPGVTRLLEEDRRFDLVAEADDADRLLYTREAYDEFPDLWVAGSDFGDARKVTDANPGLMERFAWGDAELVEWESADGVPLQGVVIKPEDWVEGERYPVLVYYYRFFSQRLHEFNDPSVNHRPSFPVYASDGYVVFLPDVRFEVGRPGLAATKSVVPGVQKLVELGIADPDRIALHGHSWSGYQTAFMVTQTDLFTTAIAGAPVSNMTSAYSGIRLGSGLARQFQYEMGQSRISGSLWEARDEYIDNSPVFFADRIDTPMLILHGDVDDAVPWEQSIELYLALRRLDKETVFLQYRDEPHHPQSYANKLDWSVKMKEWVDHYLKGTPAPRWIAEGIPYTGR